MLSRWVAIHTLSTKSQIPWASVQVSTMMHFSPWFSSFVSPPLSCVGTEACIWHFWNSIPDYFVRLKAFSAARINFSFLNCKVRGCKRTLFHLLYASSIFLVFKQCFKSIFSAPLSFQVGHFLHISFLFDSSQNSLVVSGWCPTIYKDLYKL